jgi:hypothetical protein
VPGRPCSQTIRQVVRTSAGGSQLRIRLSNAYGLTAVTIGPVRVARRVGDAAIDPASDRVVRFDGQPAVTIAPGQSVVSDAVALPVATLQNWRSACICRRAPAAPASTAKACRQFIWRQGRIPPQRPFFGGANG